MVIYISRHLNLLYILQAIADRLAFEGATVIINSRKQTNVDNALSDLKSKGYKNIFGKACHTGKIEQIKELVSFAIKHSPTNTIDILVPNAATSFYTDDIFNSEEIHWDKMFATNLKSVFFLVKYAKPYMPRGSSVIINSSLGGYRATPNLGIYHVLKTSLLGMTRMLSDRMCHQDGIRVNGIAPGVIPTKMSQAMVADKENLNKLINKEVPMKRLGTSDECASVVAFLASTDASYISGETIVVAGGARSRL